MSIRNKLLEEILTATIEGGGGSNLPSFTPPESPFANDAARDVWAAANLNLLYNGDTNFSFTLLESNSVAQRWGGVNQPATYAGTFCIAVCAGGGRKWMEV